MKIDITDAHLTKVTQYEYIQSQILLKRGLRFAY